MRLEVVWLRNDDKMARADAIRSFFLCAMQARQTRGDRERRAERTYCTGQRHPCENRKPGAKKKKSSVIRKIRDRDFDAMREMEMEMENEYRCQRGKSYYCYCYC